MSNLQRRTDVFLLRLGRCDAVSDATRVVIAVVDGHVTEFGEEVIEDHLCAKDVLTEPHHAASRDRGKSCKAQVLNLEHDTHLQDETT